jgi:hypothetical protein
MAQRSTGRALAAVHERFLAMPTAPLPELVRPVVADSWRRSLALGVDPTAESAPLDLTEAELAEYRENHPLAPMMPLIRRLLTEDADEAGHIVAIGDERGRLLWVEGHHRLRTRAERMHFVEGALWSERGAGTNAPGTALALDVPVQIQAGEHFGLGVQTWSCVAAPVHDPLTGRLLGVIDLTGGVDVAGPRTLGLVRACAAAVEAGLALQIPPRRGAVMPIRRGARPPKARSVDDLEIVGRGSRVRPIATEPATASLRLMGPDAGVLVLGERRLHLSRRHTEFVWLLASAPQGLSAQALDVGLHPDGRHLITVRAEINRLRRVLGQLRPGLLESRPYRLTVPVATDVDAVRSDLAAGHLIGALDRFAEPLPGTDAPGIRAMSEEFIAEVRQAVLDSASARALERWTCMPTGHDDAAAWQALAASVPPGSPRRAQARAHLHRLA